MITTPRQEGWHRVAGAGPVTEAGWTWPRNLHTGVREVARVLSQPAAVDGDLDAVAAARTALDER